MAGVTTLPVRCAYCSGPITLPKTYHGQPRKYCSMTCATKANDHPKHRTKCPGCKTPLICPECGWQPD